MRTITRVNARSASPVCLTLPAALHFHPRVAFLYRPAGVRKAQGFRISDPICHLGRSHPEASARPRPASAGVADQLGVCKSVVWRWETGETEPELRFLPRIFRFLGEDPRPEPEDIGQSLVRYREQRGWSRKRFATKLKVDEGTLWRWESGRRSPRAGHLAKVDALLKSSSANHQ